MYRRHFSGIVCKSLESHLWLQISINEKTGPFKCGRRHKYAAGWCAFNFRLGGTAFEGNRSIQYETRQTQVLVSVVALLSPIIPNCLA